MRFSVAKRVMTPRKPVFLAGFGTRDRKSEGVMDDIYMKAVWLENAGSRLILTFDALGGDRSFVRGLKATLGERFGLRPEDILINFSHTHCSVFLTGEEADGRRGGYSIGQDRWPEDDGEVDYTEDMRYYRHLRELTAEMAQECANTLTEGVTRWTKGISSAGISRRLMSDEGLQFKPNPQAETDRDLFVLQLCTRDGMRKAVLFSYACHPTCIGPNHVSAEFVGHACTELEEAMPGSTAVFLQGCAADIKPSKSVRDDRFKTCTVSEMQEAGRELAADVMSVLSEGDHRETKDAFEATSLEVRLFTEPWEPVELEAIVRDETKTEYRRRAARRALHAMREGCVKSILPYTVQVWTLGEELLLVALEGEVPSEYALNIKRMHPDRPVIVLGYSNGVPTYIPTRRILEEGGYEAEAFILHGFRGPFVPENEWIVLGAVRQLTHS